MDTLFALPRWQQVALIVLGGIAIVELVSRVVSRTMARSRTTIYRFDASAPGSLASGRAAPDHGGAEQAPPNMLLREDLPPAIADHLGRPRTICPCCGYPTARDVITRGSCILCDWGDVVAESPESGVAPAAYAAALADAKDNLARFGSATIENADDAVARRLSARELQLREDLRSRYDYLMSATRSDAPETWARIDSLVTELQAAGNA